MKMIRGYIRTTQYADHILTKNNKIYLIYVCKECGNECKVEQPDLACAEIKMKEHSKEGEGVVRRCRRCKKLYKKKINWKERYYPTTNKYKADMWKKTKVEGVTGETVMWFGKYKGTALVDIPRTYLYWLYNDTDLWTKHEALFKYLSGLFNNPFPDRFSN